MFKLAINGGTSVFTDEDIRKFLWPRLHSEDEEAVLNALRSKYWGGIGGEDLPNAIFEREFAKYHDARHGLTVANGTLSLELALKAGGVRPGDEVLVPAITFVASATAIVSVGAIPVFVDVDPDTCQISAAAMKMAITSKTKAAIVVHYGGYFADLDSIIPIAEKHNIFIVEDCAHAQGASWRGKGAGSRGLFGCFSFQHSKALSAGEGGIVITSDEKLFQKASLIRNIGRQTGKTTYGHYISASNWRLGGLQGALLLSRFSRFPGMAIERHKNAEVFESGLNNITGLRRLPKDDRITRRGCYFIVLDFDAELFGCSREKFIKALKAEGVMKVNTGYNRPLYKEPAFEQKNLRPFLHECIDIPDYAGMYLQNAERWASRQVTIGHTYLDGKGVRLVIDAIRKVKANVDELTD